MPGRLLSCRAINARVPRTECRVGVGVSLDRPSLTRQRHSGGCGVVGARLLGRRGGGGGVVRCARALNSSVPTNERGCVSSVQWADTALREGPEYRSLWCAHKGVARPGVASAGGWGRGLATMAACSDGRAWRAAGSGGGPLRARG